ncbi:unnamed protein product, partial [Musa banksii]
RTSTTAPPFIDAHKKSRLQPTTTFIPRLRRLLTRATMENLNVDIQDTHEASDPPERCVHVHYQQGESIK